MNKALFFVESKAKLISVVFSGLTDQGDILKCVSLEFYQSFYRY